MSPIVFELILVVGAVVGFAVWQNASLKRDMARTQAEKAAREQAEQQAQAALTASGASATATSTEPPSTQNEGH